MTLFQSPRRLVLGVLLGSVAGLGISESKGQSEDRASLYAKTFDAHWGRLKADYPYFDLYGVDWDAEREDHRPKAVAAKNADEFAWELARMILVLPDPHVSFIPSMGTIQGRWSIPDVTTRTIGRRIYAEAWPEGQAPSPPESMGESPRPYPEIVGIRGEELKGVAEILAAGPLGTVFDIRLRWPGGEETNHTLQRSETSNLPPPKKHFGDRWLVTGRVGSVGYMRVRTFDPALGTLGPDGKMTTMLRAALRELADTDTLILDLQGNGGGQVAASDPFLGHLVKRTLRYRWGNSGGKTRIIRASRPSYAGDVIAIVDGRSASGGEWAARILRDAGRAVLVGETTAGAEAAVHTSKGPDGSVVKFSAWPMVEPGREPFQAKGVLPDHSIPLTIENVRKEGFGPAVERTRRARFAKALELAGAPEGDLDSLMALVAHSQIPEVTTPAPKK